MPNRDIELAHIFPAHIADKTRRRLAIFAFAACAAPFLVGLVFILIR